MTPRMPAIVSMVLLAVAGCADPDDFDPASPESSSGVDDAGVGSSGHASTRADSGGMGSGSGSGANTSSAAEEATSEVTSTDSESTTGSGSAGSTTSGAEGELETGGGEASEESDTGAELCGNGINDALEECDDGNQVAERCAYGERSCIVCGPGCRHVLGETSFCGDGIADPEHEDCDEGKPTPLCTEACRYCEWPVPDIDQELGVCLADFVSKCDTQAIAGNGRSVAQGFQPAETGYARRVSLYVGGASPTGLELEVALVAAGGSADAILGFSADQLDAQTLASQRLAIADEQGWVHFDFEAPIAIEGGANYYVVARVPARAPEATVDWHRYNDMAGDQVDAYPRGATFSCEADCLSWSQQPAYQDQVFRVWVTEQLCL